MVSKEADFALLNQKRDLTIILCDCLRHLLGKGNG